MDYIIEYCAIANGKKSFSLTILLAHPNLLTQCTFANVTKAKFSIYNLYASQEF